VKNISLILISLFFVGCAGGNQTLRDAAASGNLLTVKKAIASGADINSQDPKNGYTPLHLAVSNDHKEVVKYLIVKKAKVNILNSRNQTALDLSDSESTDNYLKKHGAKKGFDLK
jgi:ankyrin repeat protein